MAKTNSVRKIKKSLIKGADQKAQNRWCLDAKIFGITHRNFLDDFKAGMLWVNAYKKRREGGAKRTDFKRRTEKKV